jgi:hypothetical protein
VKPNGIKHPPVRGPELQVPSLAGVTTGTRKLPNRVGLHALQGWGKSSWAAHAPSPLFLMTRGEDGLLTLIDSGQIPPTPHYAEPVSSWPALRCALSELALGGHKHRTFVLDTLNGAVRLIHEDVCDRHFDGKWPRFDAYGKGMALAQTEVIELTQMLDRLREKGMGILCLMHAQVRTFKNPDGHDYDRWEPVLDKQSWAILDRWLDMILFGMFETFVDPLSKDAASKGKVKGGQHRLIMTERHASYDAKNRHGLPEEIDGGNSAKEAWDNFVKALKNTKEKAE